MPNNPINGGWSIRITENKEVTFRVCNQEKNINVIITDP